MTYTLLYAIVWNRFFIYRVAALKGSPGVPNLTPKDQKMTESFDSSTNLKASSSSRRPIQGLYSRPTSMPCLGKNEKVIGVYNQGLGKKDMPCNSLEDMQQLYDSYASGMALTLEWFIETYSESTIGTS